MGSLFLSAGSSIFPSTVSPFNWSAFALITFSSSFSLGAAGVVSSFSPATASVVAGVSGAAAAAAGGTASALSSSLTSASWVSTGFSGASGAASFFLAGFFRSLIASKSIFPFTVRPSLGVLSSSSSGGADCSFASAGDSGAADDSATDASAVGTGSAVVSAGFSGAAAGFSFSFSGAGVGSRRLSCVNPRMNNSSSSAGSAARLACAPALSMTRFSCLTPMVRPEASSLSRADEANSRATSSY